MGSGSQTRNDERPQPASGARVLVDTPRHVATVAETMKVMRSTHDGLAARVQGFVQAAEALVAAAPNTKPPHLRRVA